MSAVVTTLIIILLTIVAIGIVWVVVKNIINKGSEEIALTSLTLDLDITRATVEDDTLSITVKRNPGEGDLTGINFVISDGYNSVVVRRNTNLPELGIQTFTFTLSQLAVGPITSISIGPIFETSSGKEIIGESLETKEYKAGEIGGGDPNYAGPPGGDPGGEDPGCTPTQTCANQGFNCGTFVDDLCGNTIGCSTCTGTDECINNICVPEDCVEEDPLVTCAGFNCGSKLSNCGNPVDCSVLAGGTCVELFGASYSCINGLCVEMTAVNLGNVLNSWPPGTGFYFDAVNLPTDLSGTGYTGKYVAFPLIDDTQCFQIIGYVQDTGIYPYAIVELDVGLNPLLISASDAYYIWDTQVNCILYSPWP